jgi:hypothetical protein
MGSARGALLAAARRIGASPADYAHRVVAGEKWCIGCKAWHAIEDFGADRSRVDGRAMACRRARNRRARSLYVPKAHRERTMIQICDCACPCAIPVDAAGDICPLCGDGQHAYDLQAALEAAREADA